MIAEAVKTKLGLDRDWITHREFDSLQKDHDLIRELAEDQDTNFPFVGENQGGFVLFAVNPDLMVWCC